MIGARFISELKYRRSWQLFLTGLGHLGRLRRYVRKTWPGNDPCRDLHDHAVYAHYDPEGVIHDYVVEQVRQLAMAGFRVTFVTNAPRMSETAISMVRPFSREMIWRRGAGYDFGAYKDGIAAIELDSCERLILMNDSVYGPLSPLRDVLAVADSAACDFWGITDSWDRNYHVQTYFVMFFRRAIASRSFRKFWSRMPYVSSKTWVIKNCEVQLSQRLTRNRLTAGVLCPYWDVAKRVIEKIERQPQSEQTTNHPNFMDHMHASLHFGRPLNSTHFFWDTLISDFRAPFIKRELIRLNPAGIAQIWRWPELLAKHSDYDVRLIQRHLQAT